MFTRYDYLIFFNHSDIATVERFKGSNASKRNPNYATGKKKNDPARRIWAIKVLGDLGTSYQ
jgi:hypothetical protein